MDVEDFNLYLWTECMQCYTHKQYTGLPLHKYVYSRRVSEKRWREILQFVQKIVQSPIKWMWNNKLELTFAVDNKLALQLALPFYLVIFSFILLYTDPVSNSN